MFMQIVVLTELNQAQSFNPVTQGILREMILSLIYGKYKLTNHYKPTFGSKLANPFCVTA